jgi:DNA-binding transcriptional MerR regulator
MQYNCMSTRRPAIRIPASAIREFEEVEHMDWSHGISLSGLLEWINAVAARFRPDEIGVDSRASQEFSPRTFRHYQTLGCIDPPERAGKQAVYRFRHYVQALLLRKLLWERVPSEKIAALMADRSTAETKQLLFEGIEIVARKSSPVSGTSTAVADGETWKRIGVVPGIELHLRGDMPKPKPAALQQIIDLLETALRKNL